jgi:hypothetical protein
MGIIRWDRLLISIYDTTAAAAVRYVIVPATRQDLLTHFPAGIM